MTEERIPDDEAVYRRLQKDRKHYHILEDGSARLTSQAFADRYMQPSVDRSSLCGSDPNYSINDQTDCVVSLVTGDVRGVASVVKHEKVEGEQVINTYSIDVHSAPLDENPAHAEVRAAPKISSKSVFRRLRESLARLASWEIQPHELR